MFRHNKKNEKAKKKLFIKNKATVAKITPNSI